MSERGVRIVLPWSVLAQANHRLMPRRGGKGLTLTRSYRSKKEAAGYLAATQLDRGPMMGRVTVAMRFYEPDRRRRDPSNLQKLIEDALSGIAYADDSQICRMTWERAGIDKANARVEIVVEPLAA